MAAATQFYIWQLLSITVWFLYLASDAIKDHRESSIDKKKSAERMCDQFKTIVNFLSSSDKAFRTIQALGAVTFLFLFGWAALNMFLIYETLPLTRYASFAPAALVVMVLTWVTRAYSYLSAQYIVHVVATRKFAHDRFEVFKRYSMLHSNDSAYSRIVKYVVVLIAWFGILVTLSVLI